MQEPINKRYNNAGGMYDVSKNEKFGRICEVEDPAAIEKICTNLCKKFTDDAAYAKDELQRFGSSVLCLALSPEHMTGKRVKES